MIGKKAHNQPMVDIRETLRTRLREAMNAEGVSNTDLSNKAGVSLTAIGKWLAKGQIDIKHLSTIGDIVKRSPAWLLGFESENAISDKKSPKYTNKVIDIHTARYNLSTNHVTLPIYNIEASAGSGAFINSEQVIDALTVTNDFMAKEIGITQDQLAIIYVRGDSMSPSLNPGDLILIDRTPLEKILHDGIYVFRLNDDLMVKRIQRRSNGNIRIRSDNKTHYPAFEINPTKHPEFNILGKVVWSWCGKRH